MLINVGFRDVGPEAINFIHVFIAAKLTNCVLTKHLNNTFL